MDNDLRLRRTRRNKDNKIFGKKILMCLSAGCFNAFNGGYHRVINKFIRKFYKILFTLTEKRHFISKAVCQFFDNNLQETFISKRLR